MNYHPANPAVAHCLDCGKGLCYNCAPVHLDLQSEKQIIQIRRITNPAIEPILRQMVARNPTFVIGSLR